MRGIVGARVLASMLVLGFAAAVPATAAATAPAAVTEAASSVTASSAVLNATVNPSGSATTYAFQYGTTTNYGTQTATTTVGAGTSTVAVHVPIANLVSGTMYHYRVVATSAGGTASGADMTLTTLRTPPSVSTAAPSVVTSSSAVVNGIVRPNGKATTYAFQYGPTMSYGLQSTVSSAGGGTGSLSVHANLPSLTSGTTYHYRLVATSLDGTTASADATFVTTGPRVSSTGALPTVSGAAAVAITTHGAQLNGAINPQGPSTTWYFQYGLTGYYGVQTSPQKLSGLGARPVNVHLSGLQSGTTYHFRLVAYSANGLYVGPDHTFATKRAGRVRSFGLLVGAYSRRFSSGVTVTVYGHLRPPSAVTARTGCRGTVAVEVRRAGATIALRRTALRGDCSYRLSVFIANARLHGSRRLGIFARFSGNGALFPAGNQRGVSV